MKKRVGAEMPQSVPGQVKKSEDGRRVKGEKSRNREKSELEGTGRGDEEPLCNLTTE